MRVHDLATSRRSPRRREVFGWKCHFTQGDFANRFHSGGTWRDRHGEHGGGWRLIAHNIWAAVIRKSAASVSRETICDWRPPAWYA
jgi:hypothetical protein